MTVNGIICPICKNIIFITKEELFCEEYIFDWYCGNSFKNINFSSEILDKLIKEKNKEWEKMNI